MNGTREKLILWRATAESIMCSMSRSSGRLVIDIDVGGTFTDAIVSSQTTINFYKVDTTPHDIGRCIEDVLQRAIPTLGLPNLSTLLRQTRVVRLATSLSINALVEAKGARCGLIISKGRRERYLSQKARPGVSFPPIVDDMVVEIDDGGGTNTHAAFSAVEDEVREKVQWLVERGALIILVSLAGTDASLSEQRAKKAVMRYFPRHFIGSVPTLLASQTSTAPDFLERTNTAILNAYCHRAMAGHFQQVEEFLRLHGYANPLLVVHSGGGSARVAKTRAVHTMSSGAAAGIFGVKSLADKYGLTNALSIDVGGTTTEIGLLRNREIQYYSGIREEGVALDLLRPIAGTLGLGGGSIVRTTSRGGLVVGPESAGAFPGPACYGLGSGDPTLTDAYLILGYVDQNYFLGGRKKTSRELAEKAVGEKLGSVLGITSEEAALSIKESVLGSIEHAVRSILEPTGLSPSHFSLVALGGGGGCIAADLAGRLGMEKTHVFRQAAVFGAFGTSGMDIVHLYERRLNLPSFCDPDRREKNCRTLNALVAETQRVAFTDMKGEGLQPEEIRFEVDLEFESTPSGIPARITLPNPFIWPAQDWPILEELVAGLIGDEGRPEWRKATVKRFFLRALVPVPHPEPSTPSRGEDSQGGFKGRRAVYGGGGRWIEYGIYEWDRLPVPLVLRGPVVVEAQDTTLLVPPGLTMDFDADYNGILH